MRQLLAEVVGFEPTVPFGTSVFKTAALSHAQPHFQIFSQTYLTINIFMSKERIPVNLRRMVIDRDGLRCVYCGVDLVKSEVHLDHVIPESQGRPTSYANLQVTCGKCNLEKGVLSESEFENKLRTRAIRILERIGYK